MDCFVMIDDFEIPTQCMGSVARLLSGIGDRRFFQGSASLQF